MYRFPFYSSPPKGKNIRTRPVKYISEDNGTKLKIVEVAKDIGIRRGLQSWFHFVDKLIISKSHFLPFVLIFTTSQHHFH